MPPPPRRERLRPCVSPGLPRRDSPRTRPALETAAVRGGRTCTGVDDEGSFHGKEVEAGRAVRDAARAWVAQARGAFRGAGDRQREPQRPEGREEGGERPALAGGRARGPRNRRPDEAQGCGEEGSADPQTQGESAQRGRQEGRENAGEGQGLDGQPAPDSRGDG